MVPSYSRSLDFLCVEGCVHSRLPSASSTKLATVLGASLSNSRHTIVPSLVSNMAYSPGWRVMNFLSWLGKFGGLQIKNVETAALGCPPGEARLVYRRPLLVRICRRLWLRRLRRRCGWLLHSTSRR